MVQKTVVRARLRQGKDDDLREAVEELIAQGYDEAALVREGLRKLLGMESRSAMALNLPAVGKRPAAPTAPRKRHKPEIQTVSKPIIEKVQEKPQESQWDADDALDALLG